KRSTHSNILRMFRKDVLPVLGKRSILELRRPDLLEVIERNQTRSYGCATHKDSGAVACSNSLKVRRATIKRGRDHYADDESRA
ncbi:MAG: hypothetical protein LBE06_06580, partial [Azoarcus sp.]|nr:hypothetical protein [Azoarcus sp.]